MGHGVTVFEALHAPGGVLMYGIPEFRLPKAIVNAEVDYIKKLGVDINYDVVVGKTISVDEILEEYDAVFIGIGAQNSSSMRVDGEDAGYKGFVPGVKFLLDINEGRDPYPEGKKVVVIGGGNVAIDCVRCSSRIGKEEVNLIYRRTRNEMPADDVEIRDAEEENIPFHFLTTPVRILEKNGKVVAMGRNDSGQLGNGSYKDSKKPVLVSGLPHITAISVGLGGNYWRAGERPHTGKHALALASNGRVWAWGNNFCGQLGDCTMNNRNTTVRVTRLKGIIQIAAGSDFNLALKRNGSVYVWGANNFGKLGDRKSWNKRYIPVKISL